MRPRGSRLHWGGALLRNLLRGRVRDAGMRADVGSFVDLLTDEKIAAGMTPEAARRAALLECGSADAVVEGRARCPCRCTRGASVAGRALRAAHAAA